MKVLIMDTYLSIVAAKIGMAPHTLKLALAVGCVGTYVWECYKHWIAPRIIAWQSRKKGPEPRLANTMEISDEQNQGIEAQQSTIMH